MAGCESQAIAKFFVSKGGIRFDDLLAVDQKARFVFDVAVFLDFQRGKIFLAILIFPIFSNQTVDWSSTPVIATPGTVLQFVVLPGRLRQLGRFDFFHFGSGYTLTRCKRSIFNADLKPRLTRYISCRLANLSKAAASFSATELQLLGQFDWRIRQCSEYLTTGCRIRF